MIGTTTIMALNVSTSADSVKPTGAGTPADALGATKRMSALEDSDNQSDGVECTTCDRIFDTSKGMKLHHVQAHGESLAGVERTCEHCGDTFRVNPAYVDRGGGRYCSHECAGIDATPGETVERECQACGETFTARQARVDRGGAQYCSMDCYHGDRDSQGAVTRTCKQCGEEFTVPATQLDHRPVKFCSLDCSGEWMSEHRTEENHHRWKGGRAPYGPGWNDQKKDAVRERDGRQCQRCGMTEGDHLENYGQTLDVHHLIPAREFDDPVERNSMNNLVTLCISCHHKWEGIPLRPEVV